MVIRLATVVGIVSVRSLESVPEADRSGSRLDVRVDVMLPWDRRRSYAALGSLYAAVAGCLEAYE